MQPKGKKNALIWVELFRLGLTKKTVRYHLNLNNYQMANIWQRPGAVLTLPQVQKLCGLVAPHYTLPQMAALLVRDEYRPGSELNTALQEAIKILMNDKGREHWDEYANRKRGNDGKRKLRKLKAKNSAEVFKRLSDEIATNENLSEFVLEHRMRQETSKPDESKDSSTPDSPVVSI